MAPRSSTSVTIEGSNDKRMITGTFAGKFLPTQLIYGGKTTQRIPKVTFPKDFSSRANSSHYSNSEESLKFLKEMVILYVGNERCQLKLPKEQKALMVIDVFTGQMTEDVVKKYQDNNILIVNVPKKGTKYYQPLDLTVNGYCQKLLKHKFTQWFSAEVTRQLANKVALEDMQVKLQLMKLKPLQDGWIIEFFNEMTDSKDSQIIGSGWNGSGIKDSIKLGTKKLPSLDPFEELDAMINETEDITRSTVLGMTAVACLSIEELEVLGSMEDDENIDEEEDDGEWIDQSAQMDGRNAFDMFDDEL